MHNSITNEYCLHDVYKTFSNVIDKSDKKSICLPEFVNAFRELAKFFDHLNVVFSFVKHDLTDKFVLLDGLYKNNPTNYATVQTMIEHEKNHEDPCGTISLLRLLRALEFTYLFLERAIISSDESLTTKQVAWEVYKQTLHKRHNKAVRLSIWLATATIPKREVLRQTLVRGEIEPGTSEKCFPLIEDVYRRIHEIYEEKNLLELVHL